MSHSPTQFLLQDQMCIRRDLELVTHHSFKIKASLYLPVDTQTLSVTQPLPCVVYLHGNSGSRMDADDLVDGFLVEKMAVFSIDFGGCGLSDGDFVTLGWREREDLVAALEYLASVPELVSHVALWGRSMGAATALLVASDDRFYHRVAGMVLDSCYTSVRQVLLELADKYVGKVPIVPFTGMIEPAVDMLRSAVIQRAGFDFNEINVIDAARHCNAPVLIGHAADDQLVLASHAHEIFHQYGGPKKINVFEGDHNSIRPQTFREQAVRHLQACFAEACAEKRRTPSRNGVLSSLFGSRLAASNVKPLLPQAPTPRAARQSADNEVASRQAEFAAAQWRDTDWQEHVHIQELVSAPTLPKFERLASTERESLCVSSKTAVECADALETQDQECGISLGSAGLKVVGLAVLLQVLAPLLNSLYTYRK